MFNHFITQKTYEYSIGYSSLFGIGVAYARLIRLKPTYIFKSYSSLGVNLPIFFKSYSSLGLTLKPTFNNGFDLLDNGLALIIQ